MNAAIAIVFLALIMSAPWIFEKWESRGELAWFIISVSFLYVISLIVGNV